MFCLPVDSLKAGMIIYEDIYDANGQIVVKSNTVLTDDRIQLLKYHQFEQISLAEPHESKMTRYKHLQSNESFKHFESVYNESFQVFMRLMKNLTNKLNINMDKFISLRNEVLASVKNGEQLLDYLYNLMPNENEITYKHCFNCGLMCTIFGEWCDIPEEEIDSLSMSGFLFDIGKTKIDDQILWKPDKLTPEEFEVIKHHIHEGYEIVKNRELPPHVVSVMIMHHERCDGTGYPAKLTKEKIDPFALIAAIADTYEAMTHPRSHRTALTPFQAIRIFEKQGFEKFGGENARIILSKIAKMYIERNVILSNGLSARISEINDEYISSPTVYGGNRFIDLKNEPDLEITRMA